MTVAERIRTFCRERLGPAAVQISSDGVERIYYAGIPLNELADAVAPMTLPTEYGELVRRIRGLAHVVKTMEGDDVVLAIFEEAAAAIEKLERERDEARDVLRALLDDPEPTLDEPDTDGEVILKMRRMVRGFLDLGLPTANEVRGILSRSAVG